MLGYEPLDKKEYDYIDEYFAKIVLEHLFPQKYSNLNKDEKPDLQDLQNNTGVEVTSAISGDWRRFIKFTDRIDYPDKYSRNIESYKKALENDKVITESLYIANPIVYKSNSTNCIEQPPYRMIIDKFLEKNNKLNGGNYKVFNENNLYIRTILHFDDNVCQRLLDTFIENNNLTHKFKNVYILAVNCLYNYDLDNKKVSFYEIEDDISIYDRAYKLVKNGDKHD